MSISSQNQRVRQLGVVRKVYKILGEALKINSILMETLSIKVKLGITFDGSEGY